MTERFSDEQVKTMQAKLDGAQVKTREQSGRTLSYLEGYQAINAANRIFGFGGWSSEVVDLRCVVSTGQGEQNYQGKDRRGYLIAYTATVRVTVHHEGSQQAHSDVGYGEGIEYGNVGQAHESAIKEAVTDAEKRALRHWGNQFGLALYDKGQREVDRAGQAPATQQPAQEGQDQGHGKCPTHGVYYFQTQKMRSPAHRTEDGGWCNKPDGPTPDNLPEPKPDDQGVMDMLADAQALLEWDDRKAAKWIYEHNNGRNLTALTPQEQVDTAIAFAAFAREQAERGMTGDDADLPF